MPVTNFSIAVLMGDVEDKEIVSDNVEKSSQNTKDYALPDHIKGSLWFCFNVVLFFNVNTSP